MASSLTVLLGLLNLNHNADALPASAPDLALHPEPSHALHQLEVSGWVGTNRSLALMMIYWRLKKMGENGYFDVLPAYPRPHLVDEGHDNEVGQMGMPRTEAQSALPGALEYGGHHLIEDGGWVQVMRFGTKCRAAIEGYHEGFVADCGSEYEQINRSDLASCTHPAKVGYGCWFYFAQPDLQTKKRIEKDPKKWPTPYPSPSNFTFAPFFGKDFETRRSSGIAVNVGKSLRVDSRFSASQALGVPCSDPPLCSTSGKAQDKLWCERASQKGYDSIQIARPHLPCLDDACLLGPPGWVTELAICTGKCMTEEVHDACPPGVELRTAGGDQCKCPKGAHHLNCGANSTLYGRADDGKQMCPHGLTSPELRELYNNQMIDPKDILGFRREQRDAIRELLLKEGKMSEAWLAEANKSIFAEQESADLWKVHYKYKALAKAFGPGAEAKRAEEKAAEAKKNATEAIITSIDTAEIAAREAADAEDGNATLTR